MRIEILEILRIGLSGFAQIRYVILVSYSRKVTVD